MVQPVSNEEYDKRAHAQVTKNFEKHQILERSGEVGTRRFYLANPKDSAFWVEIIELKYGLYVGGDIDHVVFQRHGSSDHVQWMGHQRLGDGYAFEKARIGMSSARSELTNFDQCVWLHDAKTYVEECIEEHDPETDDIKGLRKILAELVELSGLEDPNEALRERFDEEDLHIESETLYTFGEVRSARFLNGHQAIRRLHELLEAEEKAQDIAPTP